MATFADTSGHRTYHYYTILGVSSNATQDEIKKSFKKLCLKYHPDKNSSEDAQVRIQQIYEAYQVLSDEQKRRAYDIHGDIKETSDSVNTIVIDVWPLITQYYPLILIFIGETYVTEILDRLSLSWKTESFALRPNTPSTPKILSATQRLGWFILLDRFEYIVFEIFSSTLTRTQVISRLWTSCVVYYFHLLFNQRRLRLGGDSKSPFYYSLMCFTFSFTSFALQSHLHDLVASRLIEHPSLNFKIGSWKIQFKKKYPQAEWIFDHLVFLGKAVAVTLFTTPFKSISIRYQATLLGTQLSVGDSMIGKIRNLYRGFVPDVALTYFSLLKTKFASLVSGMNF